MCLAPTNGETYKTGTRLDFERRFQVTLMLTKHRLEQGDTVRQATRWARRNVESFECEFLEHDR